MVSHLGKALLIINPTAQSGRGAQSGRYATQVLQAALGADSFESVLTKESGHGRLLAEKAQDFDTVIALGGDGLVHEVINGLMTIPEANRPRFALLPVGTGNDYARTLHMSFSIEESVEQLLSARETLFDLGLCNGEYFAETLSFGLDADIAIDTVERRKRTGKTGTRLFLESGIDVLFHRKIKHSYEAQFDGEVAMQDEMYQFAVQIGKTYGGGFNICPNARTDDGLLDICIAHPPMSILKATIIFLLAKNAHHTRFKQIEFAQAQSLYLSFPQANKLPIQIDGEAFAGHEFEISCVSSALRVLVNDKL
ncbi:MAG: diacylglycerol/lipid kinase family protein [Raoultibacter sp.]|jgi:YegS/Rv2252/BmrU family lipid kinase